MLIETHLLQCDSYYLVMVIEVLGGFSHVCHVAMPVNREGKKCF